MKTLIILLFSNLFFIASAGAQDGLEIDYILENEFVCPGEITEACIILQGSYSSINWSIYPGYTGEIVGASDQLCVQVGAGHYHVEIIDTVGQEFFTVVVVHALEINLPQPLITHCDLLNEEEFDLGCDESFDNLYLSIYNFDLVFDGSYFEISLEYQDGSFPWDTIITAYEYYNIFSINAIVGDYLTVEYHQSGFGQSSYIAVLHGCQFGSGMEFDDFYPGILWEGFLECDCPPFEACWTAIGPEGFSFSDSCSSTTTFYPGAFGEYEIYCAPEGCDTTYSSTIIYSYPPNLDITSNWDIILCGDASSEFCISYSDPGDTGSIVISGEGMSDLNDENCIQVGPYESEISTVIQVELSNVCGTASDSQVVQAQMWIEEASITLDDNFLLASPDCFCTYTWYLDGDIVGETTIPVFEQMGEGNYFVVISNDCGDAESGILLVEAVTNLSGKDVLVYPNPFTQSISFETSLPIEDLIIVDATGRIVHSMGLANLQSPVYLGDLDNGIYTCVVTTTQGTRAIPLIKMED